MALLNFLTIFLMLIYPLSAKANSTESSCNPQTNKLELLKALLNLPHSTESYVPVMFRESFGGNRPLTEMKFYQNREVKISEKNYNRFRERILYGSYLEESIPRLIHIIWLGSQPPPSVIFCIESWKKYHPTWEVKVWGDEDIKNFSWTTPYSKEVFEKGQNWAEKSDILRFEILYQFGGIYSDADMICLKSFEDLITNGISFFAGYENNHCVPLLQKPLIGSAIIGSKQKHSILRRSMDLSLTVEQAPLIPQHIRSGPGPLSTACYEALKNGENEDVIIFPPPFFYPLPFTKRFSSCNEILSCIRPEALTIHLWEGSYKNKKNNKNF